MKSSLKADVLIAILIWITSLAPFIFAVTISIIGITWWDWAGRAAIVIISGIAVSIVSAVVTIGLLDDSEAEIREFLKKEATKSEPKPGAWEKL